MNKDLLVGSTGFVGQNLMTKHKFDSVCHSTDIKRYFGSHPDLCVYAGVPSAMFLANTNPEADFEIIKQAFRNIQQICPKKLVLISSIAVYDDSRNKNENSSIDESKLPAYGINRLKLEQMVRKEYTNVLVVRLPALYGVGLKKNFLYDLLTITPAMLKENKYKELSIKSSLIKDSYKNANNGFYRLKTDSDKKSLKAFFESNDFNSLAFTDSRSRFQFYSLAKLWNHIEKALNSDIKLLNITTPPISAFEVYKAVTGKSDWKNELTKPHFDYDLKSLYADKFGGNDGYFCSLEDELKDICKFMKENQK